MIMTSQEELEARAKEMKDDLKMYRMNYNDTIERVWLSIDADFVIANTYIALELFNDMCEFYDMDPINDKDTYHWMGWNYRTKGWDRIKFFDDIKIF